MILQAFDACRHDRERRLFPAAAAWLTALLLMAMATIAVAVEPAGRVIFSSGDVTAVDSRGVERALARDDVIHPGDTVRTAAQSMVDLRMSDDALVSLDPESRFAVERYDRNGTGRAVMRFLAGALRTITGAIGKQEQDTYQMHTPVATIGVRGTEYALQFCDADCARGDRPAGLYGRVDEGAISVTNDAASEAMVAGDYFHVAAVDVAPERLVRPPDGILGVMPDRDDSAAGNLAAAGGGDLLTDTSSGLLDTTGSLLTGEDDLLGTTGTVLQTGGSLLETGGNLLEGGGDLLEGTGDLLAQGGGLLEVGGGVLDTGGGVLDTGGGLLDSGGGLLDDTGDALGGSGSLLDDTDPGDDDGNLLDGVLDLL